jgi:hypothetical protein
MSATPERGREPRSTAASSAARPSGTDSTPARADSTLTRRLGDMATVDPALIEAVFDLGGGR